MTTSNPPTDRPAERSLVITRLFDAPRALVWQAWTDPDQVMRWWGPKDFTSPACKIDLRVGGRYLFCMQSPDGQKYWSTGVFNEIVPQERLVYTDSFADEHGTVVPASYYGMDDVLPLEMLVTITFEELGGRTRMTLTHSDMPAGEMSDMTGAGWNESFDKLAASLLIGPPRIGQRSAQPYMGIRVQAPMQDFRTVIPQCLDELSAWLGQRGAAPAGAPFMRYHVINMEGMMDIELGVPVVSTLPGEGRVAAGLLPAGRYAALVYTGVENGIAGNAALLDWGARQGLVWDAWKAENGDAFAARAEFYLTNPDDEPDPAKWQTEVAIRLAGVSPESRS